jgi:hypothetical protein
MPQYFKTHGEALIDLGYRIVPLPPGEKGPRMKGWPQANLSGSDVRRMAANGSAQAGVGVLAATTPAIDVDILDKEVAGQMLEAIEGIFEGHNLLMRTGKAPKFLIPFRSDEPFRKLTSVVYTDGTNDHKVEILGSGQQWVAYHVHPETERPYQWFDGLSDAGIADVPAADLPTLDAGMAQRVIDAFEVLAAGLVSTGRWTAKSVAPDRNTPDRKIDDPFAQHAEPVKDLTPAQVEWVVSRIANNEDDYDRWLSVLCAVHHQLGDDGIEVARVYSEKSSKHVTEVFEAKYASLGAYSGPMTTLRSFLPEAGQPPKPEPDLPTGATESDPFPFYAGDEYAQGFENVSEMVEDLLPDQGTGMVYGASQSGKTFWAMDIAFHVHNGEKWRGKDVKQGPVFYIAAEAGRGIRKRIAAYKAVNSDSVAPFFADTAPDLLDLTWVKRIRDSIVLRGGASLVVIDTMSASFTGDDSSQQETAVMVQNCSNLAKSLECLVLFVHHSKKDGASWRGSGVLYNDNDVVVEISADGEGDARTHCAHVVKQRDDEAGQKFGFRLVKSGTLGKKPNGKPITSCTIEQTDGKPVKKTGKKSGGSDFENNPQYGQARHYLDILADLAGLGNAAVEEAVFVHAVQNDETVNPESEPDYPKPSNIRRSVLRLAARGKVSVESRWIRLLA